MRLFYVLTLLAMVVTISYSQNVYIRSQAEQANGDLQILLSSKIMVDSVQVYDVHHGATVPLSCCNSGSLTQITAPASLRGSTVLLSATGQDKRYSTPVFKILPSTGSSASKTLIGQKSYDTHIYPNPSSSFVTILSPQYERCVIYNIESGKKMIETKASFSTVDVSRYTPGQYVALFYSANNSVFHQVFTVLR